MAIDDLPGRLQETFKLYFQEEHSYQQIATELHISCPNVRKRISQARAILHKRLEEYEGISEKTVFESGKKEKSEPEELPEEFVVPEISQEEVLSGVENESIFSETVVEEQLPEIENVASGLKLPVKSISVSRLKLWVSLSIYEHLSPDPSPARRGERYSPFPTREGGWGVRFLNRHPSISSFSRKLENKNFLFYPLEMGGLRPYFLVRKQVIKSKLYEIRGSPVGEIYLPTIGFRSSA